MDSVISVILPSYNHEKYIGYAIQSVLNQTYKNIELVIIDDCSTDKTNEIIQSYSQRCEEALKHFIYIKKEENKGVIDSLNSAVDLSTGEYCFFMASDDVLKPNAVKTLCEVAKNNKEYGFIGGNSELIDENNQRCYWDDKMRLTHNIEEAKYLTWGDLSKFATEIVSKIDYDSNDFGSYESLLRSNYIVNGFMYKKSVILDVGKYKQNVFEDWYMALEVAKKYKFKYIDEVVYEYRKHFSNSIDNVCYSKPRYYTTIASQKKYCYENNLKELWDEAYGLFCGEKESEFIDKYLMPILDEKKDDDILFFCDVIQEKNDEIKKLKEKIEKLSKKKNIFEKIFSIKNTEDRKHKIITFMGIKINIKRSSR